MSDYENEFVLVVSAPEVSGWLYVFNSNPSGFTIAWCSGAAHTDVSFEGTSCRCLCCRCRSCCWCCGLSIAPWSSELCGLQSMLGGVATQLAWLEKRHNDRVVLTVSASVTACRIFIILVSCTFSITIVTSSMIMMSGCFWLCLWMEGQLTASQLFFLWNKCLLVSVRGYCMLHGWIMRSDVVLGVLHSQLILRGCLWLAVFVFCNVWRVDRLMHDGGIFMGQFFGNETAVRSVVSFLMLQKADSLISDVRDGW